MLGKQLKRQQTRVLQQLTADQRQEVTEAFELFDTAKTGTLTHYEVKVLIRALGFPVKKSDVIRMIHDIDAHNDGTVTLQQLCDMVSRHYSALDPEEEMVKAFSLFDADSSGRIALEDLRRVAMELGERLTDDDLQAMIDEFDRDQDGFISREEFLAIMRNSDAF